MRVFVLLLSLMFVACGDVEGVDPTPDATSVDATSVDAMELETADVMPPIIPASGIYNALYIVNQLDCPHEVGWPGPEPLLITMDVTDVVTWELSNANINAYLLVHPRTCSRDGFAFFCPPFSQIEEGETSAGTYTITKTQNTSGMWLDPTHVELTTEVDRICVGAGCDGSVVERPCLWNFTVTGESV